jgi:hypothetical protein
MTYLGRFNVLLPYLPFIVLWVAVAATASLVLRELGFARIKKYPLTLLVLFAALSAFPAAGIVKMGRPYERRIMAMIRREKSPEIVGVCPMFPENNIWNRKVNGLAVDPRSPDYVQSIGAVKPLHPDFGVGAGIPFAVTDGSEGPAVVSFSAGAAESERGPYMIPEKAPIEPARDSHVLVLNTKECRLYELFGAKRDGVRRWQASSGAIFDLRSNQLRPDGWTSADAAGLPILPGLVRYDEVATGKITHAVRLTVQRTRRAYVWPARHYAAYSTDPALPPMGQRFRLRASFNVDGYSPQARVILTALKEYGMILADNGGDWYISGAPDSRWERGLSAQLAEVRGTDFEAVDSAPLMVAPNSGEARQ